MRTHTAISLAAGMMVAGACLAQGHDAPQDSAKTPAKQNDAPARPASPSPPPEKTPAPVPGNAQLKVQTRVLDRGYANADELLTALETADAGMTTLTADIVYDKTFGTAGDRQARVGKLYFQSLPPDVAVPEPGMKRDRRFAIHFETLVVGQREEADPQIYIFDGTWLLEKRPNDKRFVRRQVVPAGEQFDPLKIGEGPLPIPIGQRKDDILSRYDAELLPAADGLTDAKQLAFVEGAYQLKLIPKPERRHEDKFAEIRLWYKADKDVGNRLIPRMARTMTSAADLGAQEGDESLVRLVKVRVNDDIPAGMIDPKPPGEGWDGQIVEFRGGDGGR